MLDFFGNTILRLIFGKFVIFYISLTSLCTGHKAANLVKSFKHMPVNVLINNESLVKNRRFMKLVKSAYFQSISEAQAKTIKYLICRKGMSDSDEMKGFSYANERNSFRE